LSIVFYFFSINENITLILISSILLVAILNDRMKLDFVKSMNMNKLKYSTESFILKKEIMYYKYFTSEQYYLVATFIFYLVFVFFVVSELDISDKYTFIFWVQLAIAVFPFSLTLFNLFGMDINCLSRFFRDPLNTINLQITRIRYYLFQIYVLHIIVLIKYWFIFKDIYSIIVYSIAAILFNELLLTCSLLYSLMFIEKKEIKFRYGQYFKSKNVNLLSIILFLMVVLVHFIYSIFQIWGFIIIGIAFVLFNIYFLKKISICLINKKKKDVVYER